MGVRFHEISPPFLIVLQERLLEAMRDPVEGPATRASGKHQKMAPRPNSRFLRSVQSAATFFRLASMISM
jgi:hypothetical protein